MKTYKILSADKAAFLNRLEKMGVLVNSEKIEDDKLSDPSCFKITFTDPEAIKVVNGMLKKSPKINDLKETIIDAVKEIFDGEKPEELVGEGSGIKTIVITCKDDDNHLEELLNEIKERGNSGYSFNITIDNTEPVIVHWDGDGNDSIESIKVTK